MTSCLVVEIRGHHKPRIAVLDDGWYVYRIRQVDLGVWRVYLMNAV